MTDLSAIAALEARVCHLTTRLHESERENESLRSRLAELTDTKDPQDENKR